MVGGGREGGGGPRERLFRGQDYNKLRARCLSEGRLFEDPEFPADDHSLGFDKEVIWRRPTELVHEPRFLLNGDRFSVVQGQLGDCWFVSALSAITLNPALLQRVVPRDQSFHRKYVGIFHFRFWQGGEWLDVVVDDRLPTDPFTGTLCFSNSAYKREFWSALLEKAYAKLHGSYGSLNSGKSYEATEDLTGGVTERFPLQQTEDKDDLFSIMVQTSQRGSLLTCSVPGRRQEEQENGLVSGHGYCVTGVRRCKVNVPWRKHVELVRLRNPWGDETEWQGAWSDKSEEWGLVPEEEKRRLHHTVDSDGEFWMTFKEFKNNFDELYITSLNPHTLDTQAREHLYTMAEVVQRVLANPEQVKRSGQVMGLRKVWEEVKFDGSWVRNSTAGGAPSNIKLFSSNPQYLLHLTEADDDPHREHDPKKTEETCTVVLSLTQKHRRVRKLPLLRLGVVVYQVPEEGAPTPLTAHWMRCQRWEFLSKFKKARSITHRLALTPGRYVLIPCTLEPNQEGEFLLRAFCEKGATMEENDEEARLLDVSEDLTDSKTSVCQETEERKSSVLKGVFLQQAGTDGTINALKMQVILNHVFSGVLEFSQDMARSLLALVDRDLSGNVDFYEFEPLVHSLRRWVSVYNARCDPEIGSLTGHAWSLGEALRDLGYQVPRRLQGLVVVRYGDEQGNISLQDFLMASCRISVMLERYPSQGVGGKTSTPLPLNDWLQHTLYC